MANSNLAAVVTSDNGMLFLIYQDASFRVKFPSGHCIDVKGPDVQTAIALAKKSADIYCRAEGSWPPNCRTWFVPSTSGLDILDWLTGTVGLEIEVNTIGEHA